MIVTSTNYPSQTVQMRQKGYAIIFDIVESTGDEGTMYTYKEVIAASMDLPIVAAAVLRHYYSPDDELRLLNDYLVNGESDEWAEYQSIRQKSISVARNAIGDTHD